MKTIAKIIFKVHRLIYKYPTKTEIRLVIKDNFWNTDLTWFVGMLYLCGDTIQNIASDFDMTEQEIKDRLNKLAEEVDI